MSPSSPAQACSHCGSVLPADVPESQCPRCLMAEAMQPTGGSKPADPWQPPTAAELHQVLPQYEIELMLGRGGMGAVYKGRQISLGRPVAIKILSAALDEAGAGFAERFKNEARAMAMLTHPGIVAVYDFGQTASGLLYIVMEFVEGTDVARMVARQKRLHSEHAMAITAHVLDALLYAHERGVIHRDIKPANIMVGYDGMVKVADFGLAKVSTSAGESQGLTQSGVTMGTLHFMAPEALMLGSTVDQRADIYAVGVMLYQMLTGKLPHGMFELPSIQVQGLDPRYDGIITRAMREDREVRYQSAREMRQDLDGILTQPVARVDVESPQGAALPEDARPLQAPAKQPRRPAQAALPPAKAAMPPAPASPSSSMRWWLVLAVLVCSGLGWFLFGRNSEPHAPSQESETAAAAPAASTASPISATKAAPFTNTLGMKFVPVPGTKVLFSIWDTRCQDYAAYSSASPSVDDLWKKQSFDGMPCGQVPDHPVVGVSWNDAQAFCQWLTAKEIAAGKLPQAMRYRLPSDEEWSIAVGLSAESGATPKEKVAWNEVDFPWGRNWPPKAKAGNYADETFHAQFPPKQRADGRVSNQDWIKGYDDGYATTSPVGIFPANMHGLYDMGGNVQQWCEDWCDAERTGRVLRGASFYLPFRNALYSAARHPPVPPQNRGNYFGFRCVLDQGPASPVPFSSFVPGAVWRDRLAVTEGWNDWRRVGGELHVNDSNNGRNFPERLVNTGLRIRFRLQEETEFVGLEVRRTSTEQAASSYEVTIWRAQPASKPGETDSIRSIRLAQPAGSWPRIGDIKAHAPVLAGEEHTAELYAIGDRITFFLDGRQLGFVQDARLKEGSTKINMGRRGELISAETADLGGSVPP